MGRSFQWAADSTWVETIIQDNTRFNPKLHLREEVATKQQGSHCEFEQHEFSDEDESSDGFSSDDELTLGSLKSTSEIATKWDGIVRWHSSKDKLGEFAFLTKTKTASVIRDPNCYF